VSEDIEEERSWDEDRVSCVGLSVVAKDLVEVMLSAPPPTRKERRKEGGEGGMLVVKSCIVKIEKPRSTLDSGRNQSAMHFYARQNKAE